MNTKTNMEASPTEQNLDTILYSQQKDKNLNETIETNFISPIPLLQRKNSVHIDTELVIFNTFTQQSSANNQNSITQQLVNFVRQFSSKNVQQPTNAPTPYYLKAVSTQ